MTLALDAFCAMPFVMLRKNERPLKYAGIRITNGIINFLLVVFFIIILPKYPNGIFGLKYSPEFGIGYVFVANLVASSITFLMLSQELLIARIKYFSWELWKKMIKYSWPITIAGLAGIINETFDRQFLKFLLPEDIGRHELGVYGGVAKVVTFVILFRQAYSLGIEPFFFSNSKKDNAKEMYVRLMDIFIAINCLIVLFLSVNLDWISKVYINNPEYYEGIGILPILFFASLFLGIYLNLSIWYKLTDNDHWSIYFRNWCLITILINFYFIPKYGYWASTWATIASYFAMMVISYIWGHYKYPIPYNVYKNITVITITMLVSLVCYQYLKENIWLGNVIFLILATFLLRKEKLIPAKILNKIKRK